MRQAPNGPVLSAVANEGFTKRMDRAAYDRLDAINYSRLKKLLESPLHMKQAAKFMGSASTDFGNIVDEMLLGKIGKDSCYRINPYPDFRTKDAQAFRDDMNAHGIIIINQIMLDSAARLVKNILSDEPTKKFVDRSQKQIVLAGRINGVMVKGRADMIVFNDAKKIAYPADLKTANSITTYDIKKSIRKFGYYTQCGIYVLLLEANGYTVPSYKWLFAESDMPYDYRWVQFKDKQLEYCKSAATKLIERYKTCLETDTWPGYDKACQDIAFSEQDLAIIGEGGE